MKDMRTGLDHGRPAVRASTIWREFSYAFLGFAEEGRYPSSSCTKPFERRETTLTLAAKVDNDAADALVCFVSKCGEDTVWPRKRSRQISIMSGRGFLSRGIHCKYYNPLRHAIDTLLFSSPYHSILYKSPLIG